MIERVKLEDFDILGIITLHDVQGIEEYVTPIIKDGKKESYLSRSREYYNVKTLTELSEEREKLKALLTPEFSKRNFVILENILNCSAKVYFKEFEQYIRSGKSEESFGEFEQAQKCLMEDVKNIITIFDGKGSIVNNPNNILPTGERNCERRFIEMDNKAMLYVFANVLKTLDLPRNSEVLTPGYGSVYIGPFLKHICGYNFTNMLKSKYIDELANVSDLPIQTLMSSERIPNGNAPVLLLDDNIGTGSTMREIKECLKSLGKEEIISGAVQYNWRNYYRVSIGEKTDIDRFEANDYEILTPLNYAGHKLFKHAVDALNSSGEEYIAYLNGKNYRNEKYSDFVGAFLRGINWSQKTKLELLKNMPKSEEETIEVLERYRNTPNSISNECSRKIIDRYAEIINVLNRQGPPVAPGAPSNKTDDIDI